MRGDCGPQFSGMGFHLRGRYQSPWCPVTLAVGCSKSGRCSSCLKVQVVVSPGIFKLALVTMENNRSLCASGWLSCLLRLFVSGAVALPVNAWWTGNELKSHGSRSMCCQCPHTVVWPFNWHKLELDAERADSVSLLPCTSR